MDTTKDEQCGLRFPSDRSFHFLTLPTFSRLPGHETFFHPIAVSLLHHTPQLNFLTDPMITLA